MQFLQKDYSWIKKQLNFTKDHNDTMDYLDLIDFIEEQLANKEKQQLILKLQEQKKIMLAVQIKEEENQEKKVYSNILSKIMINQKCQGDFCSYDSFVTFVKGVQENQFFELSKINGLDNELHQIPKSFYLEVRAKRDIVNYIFKKFKVGPHSKLLQLQQQNQTEYFDFEETVVDNEWTLNQNWQSNSLEMYSKLSEIKLCSTCFFIYKFLQKELHKWEKKRQFQKFKSQYAAILSAQPKQFKQIQINTSSSHQQSQPFQLLSPLQNTPMSIATKFTVGKAGQESQCIKPVGKTKETFTDRYNVTSKINLDESQNEIIQGKANYKERLSEKKIKQYVQIHASQIYQLQNSRKEFNNRRPILDKLVNKCSKTVPDKTKVRFTNQPTIRVVTTYIGQQGKQISKKIK